MLQVCTSSTRNVHAAIDGVYTCGQEKNIIWREDLFPFYLGDAKSHH